jgi:hypothetical protein
MVSSSVDITEADCAIDLKAYVREYPYSTEKYANGTIIEYWAEISTSEEWGMTVYGFSKD